MDVQDYERLRNLTLLFFLERLLEKRGESRSLHDLSCQFGTKGFSKEMRQIAGGSKAGLRRFLSQYPALFSVGDDIVSVAKIPTTSVLRQETATVDCDDGERDYGYEAMLYFKQKLRQYGEGIEVPIKSLLGHRSQAPPEVRHVSGQHIKEFRDFLCRYPDEFFVTEEGIYLRELGGGPKLPAEKTADCTNGVEDDAEERERRERLVRHIRSHLTHDPTTISDLLRKLTAEFTLAGEGDFPYSTEQNLRTFLKIYPNSFTVQGMQVCLASSSSPSRGRLKAGSNSNSTDEVALLNSSNSSISLKDRIGSVIKKAVADNSQTHQQLPSTGNSNNITSSIVPSWLDKPRLVTSEQEARDALSDIVINWSPVVAVEVKGANLGPEGKITSVHLGSETGRSYIFDFMSPSMSSVQDCFKGIFEDDTKVKVLHDCRNESATLWFQNGILIKNVFDTQAAFAVIQHQDNVNAVHKVKNVSMLSLCKYLEVGVADELERYKSKRDQRFWTKRPLDHDTAILASLEVYVLAALLYPKLKSMISLASSSLFAELCEEQLKLHIDPEAIKSRKNQRKIDLEVADIKRKLEAPNGKNVVLTNREIRLLRFIELTEEDKKKIKGSAKVAKKLERLSQPAQDEDAGDSNPPSLESVSSGSEHSSPSHSLEHPGLERIEKLEAMLDRIEATSSASPTLYRTASTQTLSTGDIVMTKVYADKT